MDKHKKTNKTREEKLADAVRKTNSQDETDAYYKALDIIGAGTSVASRTRSPFPKAANFPSRG